MRPDTSATPAISSTEGVWLASIGCSAASDQPAASSDTAYLALVKYRLSYPYRERRACGRNPFAYSRQR
jgi:hypothetical protein